MRIVFALSILLPTLLAAPADARAPRQAGPDCVPACAGATVAPEWSEAELMLVRTMLRARRSIFDSLPSREDDNPRPRPGHLPKGRTPAFSFASAAHPGAGG